MTIKTFDAFSRLSTMDISRFTNFLYEHLEEYRDAKSAIRKAIQYSAKERTGLGGYVFALEEGNDVLGVVVVNKTGMDEYIAENILVYVAVHKAYRKKGIGKKLIDYTLDYCKGDMILHISKDNPAMRLFEKKGFECSYQEMLLKR